MWLCFPIAILLESPEMFLIRAVLLSFASCASSQVARPIKR
jgi:hypothetical protein